MRTFWMMIEMWFVYVCVYSGLKWFPARFCHLAKNNTQELTIIPNIRACILYFLQSNEIYIYTNTGLFHRSSQDIS